jgi:hypothetical protein
VTTLNEEVGPKCAAACKSLNACQQFREGEWLDEVVIASRTQAAHPFINFAESADDKDWRPDPMFSQALHNGDTIDIRQHTINRSSLPLVAKSTWYPFVVSGSTSCAAVSGSSSTTRIRRP